MASRFWVGGTGTWDASTTTHWSATTGGAGGASAPTTGDTVTFDGNSGASAVITADTTINNLSLASITMDALVGTLDFSVNNPNITLTGNPGFSCNGAAIHTLNLGSGTFTMTANNGAVWQFTTTTNLTLSAASSTLVFNGSPVAAGGAARIITLSSNAKTYGTITISGDAGMYTDLQAGGGAIGLTALNLTAPVSIRLNFSTTMTISNAFTWAGTAFNNVINLFHTSGAGATISAASGSTLAWSTLQGVVFSGSVVNATNSFDMKGNNMNGGSITGPSGGASVVGVIGS